ncbi:hypothetical protein Hanom_Chr13g01195421 [Helianthus anomalus]
MLYTCYRFTQLGLMCYRITPLGLMCYRINAPEIMRRYLTGAGVMQPMDIRKKGASSILPED